MCVPCPLYSHRTGGRYQDGMYACLLLILFFCFCEFLHPKIKTFILHDMLTFGVKYNLMKWLRATVHLYWKNTSLSNLSKLTKCLIIVKLIYNARSRLHIHVIAFVLPTFIVFKDWQEGHEDIRNGGKGHKRSGNSLSVETSFHTWGICSAHLVSTQSLRFNFWKSSDG